MPKIHYTRFPVTSRTVDEVADLLARQQVCNKSATSRCNGIWETRRHNRHNGLLPAPTCYGLAIYGETGAMDFSRHDPLLAFSSRNNNNNNLLMFVARSRHEISLHRSRMFVAALRRRQVTRLYHVI